MDSRNLFCRTILGLCARDHGHPDMYERLNQALFAFDRRDGSWEQLVHGAEHHGISPLLYKHITHLGFNLPDGHHRILRSLCQRCRLSNQIRNSAIAELIGCYQQEKIGHLLVKGIALANFVYSDPDLRPMRDIDLLVRRNDLEKAENILLELGYHQKQNHEIPEGYYHLPPLEKTIEGLPVTIELHHNLLPLDPSYPRWPLEKSFDSVQPITIKGIETATLNLEDNLYYLYLHGFCSPLTYEEFRFIHVADIVSLTEKFYQQVDWHRVHLQFRRMPAILSRFHFITPWQEKIISGLKLDLNNAPSRPGIGYRGWPLHKITKGSLKGLLLLIYETLYPSQWWTQIYYGHISGMDYLRVRLFLHPRAIWRWIKALIHHRFKQSSST
jgi:hypothetical protein